MSAPAAGVAPPRAYAPSALRLALLVLEGYAWLLGIVVAFAAVVAFLAWGLLARRPLVAVVALFVGVPSVMVTAAAIRALFFRLPAPRGIAIDPRDAPALATLVDDVARALGAGRIQRIVVTTAFNASMVQASGLPFGRPRGTLLLGFPMLATLSAEQLRAVVAHELAHLVHSHGLVAGLVYRTRRSWMQLVAAVHQRGAMPIFVRWPFARYVPRLERQSAATARAQELLADHVAAAHTDARTTADVLVLMDVGCRLLDDRFWPDVLATVEHEPEPPRPYARLRDAGVRLEAAAEVSLLRELLGARTEDDDSHPCLTDRLAALGEPARVPPRASRSAGEALLGARLDALAARLDDEWRDAQREWWRTRHDEMRRTRGRLEALDATPPSAEAAFERATLVEELRGADDALPLYRAALDVEPDHAAAALATGRLLLARNDAAGVALVERALARDPALEEEGCALLEEFHERRGRAVEAHRWHTRGQRQATRNALATAERTTVSPLDRFAPHALDARELAAVRAALAAERGVREAFLAVRELRHSPGTQAVLALAAEGAVPDALSARVRDAAALGPEAAIVMLDRRQRALREVLAAVPAARILGRSTGP